MKRLVCLIMLVLCLTPLTGSGEAGAMTQERQRAFLSKANPHSWAGDDERRGIECFDVSERGDIAVGMRQVNGPCLVSVYDREGRRLWGLSFQATGKYYLEWAGPDAISIYWVRSAVRGTFDAQGNCLMLEEYKDDPLMAERFRALGAPERAADGEAYQLDAALGFLSSLAPSYSRVLRSTREGQEIVVVDMTGGNAGGVLFVCGLLVFIAAVASILFKRYGLPKHRKPGKGHT